MMVETTKTKKKYTKPLIAVACAAVVGLSVYADWQYGRHKAEPAGTLYQSSMTGEEVRMLGEATYVGALQDEEGQETSYAPAAESYFAAALTDRQTARDESLELLQTVVDSSESMPDAKNEALMSMTAIAAAMEAESNIETLIRAKGFEDCLAVVSDDNVNVIVRTNGLLSYEVAQIKEIVMNEMDIPAENIRIIEKVE